jgi:DNA-binding transcriptional LysR family regulator
MLDDMAIFVEVVDAGGFTAASERLGLRKSTVSRRSTALEDHLGIRLLKRATRKLRLTEAGQEYNARCVRIVAETREANQAIADSRGTPRGTLHIATTQLFAETFLPPILAACLARYRYTEVEIEFSQAKVDLVAEGFDLPSRIGPLQDSSLIARPLGMAMTGCCASPAYLRERGTSRTPEELRSHDCILVEQSGSREEWAWRDPGRAHHLHGSTAASRQRAGRPRHRGGRAWDRAAAHVPHHGGATRGTVGAGAGGVDAAERAHLRGVSKQPSGVAQGAGIRGDSSRKTRQGTLDARQPRRAGPLHAPLGRSPKRSGARHM